MKLGEFQVVGVSSREKDGVKSYNLFCVTPFEDWENGSGLKCVSEWTRVDVSSLKQGDVIIPIYKRGFQGKAQFSGFTLVK